MTVLPIPESAEDVTPGWLEQALHESGIPGSVRLEGLSKKLTPAGTGTGFLSDLVRIEPTYRRQEACLPSSLILKLPRANPSHFSVAGYDREVNFYTHLASESPVRTPACYFARFDPSTGRFAILMEDLSSLTAGDDLSGCSYTEAEAAVVAAGRFHARWWGIKRTWALQFLRLDTLPGLQPALIEEALSTIGQELSETAVQVARLTPGARPLIQAYVDACAPTLRIGDFRLDNMFFDSKAGVLEAVLIDWQGCLPGGGALEVARFITTGLAVDTRKQWQDDLLHVYHSTLVANGITGFDFATCRHHYTLGQVLNLCMWLQVFAALPRTGSRAGEMMRTAVLRAAHAVTEFDAPRLIADLRAELSRA